MSVHSSLGRALSLHLWGESHGAGVGVIVEGMPPGTPVDAGRIQAALDRRRPGTSDLVTPRAERDTATILSGVHDGRATGAPIHACIWNADVDSSAYADRHRIPRPGHADYPASVHYRGFNDVRGGGAFSGRLTAAYVMAGAIARPLLDACGIRVGAHLVQVGPERADGEATMEAILSCAKRPGLACAEPEARGRMERCIRDAAAEGDSVGAVIECRMDGIMAGVGEPHFGRVDALLAYAMMGIPGTKGVSFGAGFDAAAQRGSAHNDPYAWDDGRVVCGSNNAGGILGGITTGMPLVFHVAVKPTPSIACEQKTVDLVSKTAATLRMEGRHDPCIGVRAVPVVEHLAAFVLADILRGEGRV